MRSVLIAFADDTLGGTSRSALGWGQVYAEAGWQVLFRPMRGIHPRRTAAFRAVGTVIDDYDDLRGTEPPLLSLHHGAWSKRMLTEVRSLAVWTESQWSVPLDIISNNIFAVSDRVIDQAFPRSRHTTAVLGDWAFAQYISNTAGTRRSAAVTVVPNPQDDAFFRPPSLQERDAARRRLQIPEGSKVVLRLGSPHEGKWSASYDQLVSALEDATLILVGSPESLRLRLRGKSGIRLIEPLGDDEAVRELYWAADVFAHDAVRGESFGNVIVEAMLCGIPVVYRGRPLRDNTPHEFVDLPGFYYCGSTRAWITVLSQQEALSSSRVLSNEVGRYGVSQLSQLLRKTEEIGRVPVRLPLAARAVIFLLHNPLVAALKQARLNRR